MSYDQLLQKAIELHQQGSLDEAEVIYREILETAPENTAVMHFLAMIAVTKGAYDNAIDLLYKAIALDKKAAALRFNLGMALQGNAYYNEAIEQYKTAIKFDKSFAPEGYNNIGNCFKIIKESAKAQKAYRQVIEANPNAFYAYNGLGLLLREEGKTDEAMESFQKAIDVAPDVADAYANLATSLRAEGRFDEALLLYEKALTLEPNSPLIYNSMGMALELRGDNDAALNAYKKALEIDSDFPDALVHLASFYMQQDNKVREAENLLRKATELAPDYAEAWVNLGVVLYKRELYLEAMEAYRKAIILNPKNAEVSNNLAVAVHATGDLEEAAGLCFNAIANDPELKAAHNTLANILVDMYEKDKEEALATAKAWVKHCPHSALAKHTLAAFTGKNIPVKAEKDYIATLFDGFAEGFDATLRNLDYKAPELIAESLKKQNIHNADILDLGCGSGLGGKAIKPFAHYLVGVDLSSKMLQKAYETACYNDLQQEDIEAYLAQHTNRFDVVTAADVLCYFGKIDDVCNDVFAALKERRLFVFTLEKSTKGKDFVLQRNGRYAHNEKYIKTALDKGGFVNVTIANVELRKEKGQKVEGFLITAFK